MGLGLPILLGAPFGSPWAHHGGLPNIVGSGFVHSIIRQALHGGSCGVK